MKTVRQIIILCAFSALLACGDTGNGIKNPTAGVPANQDRTQAKAQSPVELTIIQSWQGDFPVDQLDLLPEHQRDKGVGFIGEADAFSAAWQAFQPSEAVPRVDFAVNMVIFVRNIQFYNHITIGKVEVNEGLAEVLAMETMSARPIETKVAMSMVVVARDGITGIRSGDGVIQVK